MRTGTFAAEAGVEESHWWFVGRRKLFARLIATMRLAKSAAILDVGTSTGTNLRLLRDEGFDNVQGIDLNPEAKRFCESKGLGRVCLGSILDLPYRDNEFDLLLATDIIEHVDDDTLALQEVHRVLRPGGRGIITVPAFMCHWGRQDIIGEHRRRYRLNQLVNRVTAAGLEVRRSFYFNYILFFPILLVRKAVNLLGIPLRSENDVNFGLMNALLKLVFQFDIWSAAYLKPPFGVSALVVCQKPELEQQESLPGVLEAGVSPQPVRINE